jgi:hypothetical protein
LSNTCSPNFPSYKAGVTFASLENKSTVELADSLKNMKGITCVRQWLTHVIPASPEVKTGRIEVQVGKGLL